MKKMTFYEKELSVEVALHKFRQEGPGWEIIKHVYNLGDKYVDWKKIRDDSVWRNSAYPGYRHFEESCAALKKRALSAQNAEKTMFYYEETDLLVDFGKRARFLCIYSENSNIAVYIQPYNESTYWEGRKDEQYPFACGITCNDIVALRLGLIRYMAGLHFDITPIKNMRPSKWWTSFEDAVGFHSYGDVSIVLPSHEKRTAKEIEEILKYLGNIMPLIDLYYEVVWLLETAESFFLGQR